ncbi:uncharacterized protein LOC107647158 [Arachis ipaensis]|uniref:uncharacterized protein LOC107647158 n=1 Tax=Arachis ipaensis TaxID=130454 RepID=UPI0007AEF52C|nr:uncharacterized protein LOC107647158 [Arachis ipaensis]XP_025627923.1 uncharacterized protein LOC112721058 [Arachis hypogaea]
MNEVHKGACVTHIGGQSLASKILRAGYYWPTLQQDCMYKVKHCDHCQRHAPVIHNPVEQLHSSEGLRKKLEDSKGEWGYNTTEQSSTKETPFRMVYGCDAMLPIEVSLQSPRTENINEDDNIQNRRTKLDLVEEDRNKSTLQQLATKRAIARKYNKNLKPRTSSEDNLVLRKIENVRKPTGHDKLSTNWEGPFRIYKVIGKGAYKIQTLDGTILPNNWNISSLKMYYI